MTRPGARRPNGNAIVEYALVNAILLAATIAGIRVFAAGIDAYQERVVAARTDARGFLSGAMP